MRPRSALIGFQVVALTAVLALSLAGCAGVGTGVGNPPSSAASTTEGQTSASPSVPSSASPSSSSSDEGVGYRVTYPFAVPSSEVTINNPAPPLGTPPNPALPYLVGIYVGNHPDENPAYQRISFYFRGGFPSYKFAYVDQVLSDGAGQPVPLTGNRFLHVVFVNAQAHNDSGASTIAQKPANPIGYTNLKSYGAAGDFEGHVSYGLGLQAGSALPIRIGELTRPDGQGSTYYVVAFDVKTV